jgi:hypothetical protein
MVNPNQEDGDGDGVGDVCDLCPEVASLVFEDRDEDWVVDACDDCIDTDWDGYGNPKYANACDEDNCPNNFNPDQKDWDGDGLGDVCDLDDDNDGCEDGRDLHPLIFSGDTDQDGISSDCDNCPKIHNAKQADEDRDGLGNACDDCTDTDHDGLGDPGFSNNLCEEDNCPITPNGKKLGTCVRLIGEVPLGTRVICNDDGNCRKGEACQKDQEDINKNGIGDVCECYGDLNCDGKVDYSDIQILNEEFGFFKCKIYGCKADCNDDGYVNQIDLEIVRTQMGKKDCPPCP